MQQTRIPAIIGWGCIGWFGTPVVFGCLAGLLMPLFFHLTERVPEEQAASAASWFMYGILVLPPAMAILLVVLGILGKLPGTRSTAA